jgi:magnesium transporter
MARFLKSRKKSHGTPPGSLIFIGNKKMEEPEIYFMLYNKDSVAGQRAESLDEIPEVIPNGSVLWLNIYGLQDTELIARIAERFNIPQLEQEDILNTDQRPKITGNDSNLTVFLKVLEYKPEIEKVTGDHISIVIGKNYVITFQEKIAHNFEPVRERIRNGKGRIRKMGADYLAYTLMDTLVDMYIHTIESVGTVIEDMEEEILTQTKKSTLEKTYRLKTNVGFIRKNIWPIKEIMFYLNKTETALVDKKTLAFYKDLNDLTLQALEAVDIYFNMTNDYLNIYHANVGNRTNEVMKVLTIFASIFIPLTFIAGVYGTNFNYIPELEYRYGYFIMLGGMLILAAVMLYFFRKKDWL